MLTWEPPDIADERLDELQGYNVYRSVESSGFELLAYSQETSYMIDSDALAGQHSYYLTAVYDEEESLPSEEILIIFYTPKPEALQGISQANSIVLSWMEPNPGSEAMASLIGYNIFHKFEDGAYELIEFTQSISFNHENLVNGLHHYYITAVFDGGESDPSDEIEVSLVVSGINQEMSNSTKIYPNPASDFIYISTENEIKSVRILNQSGQVQIVTHANSFNPKIDISNLPSGFYTILIESKDGLLSKKLIVK